MLSPLGFLQGKRDNVITGQDTDTGSHVHPETNQACGGSCASPFLGTCSFGCVPMCVGMCDYVYVNICVTVYVSICITMYM